MILKREREKTEVEKEREREEREREEREREEREKERKKSMSASQRIYRSSSHSQARTGPAEGSQARERDGRKAAFFELPADVLVLIFSYELSKYSPSFFFLCLCLSLSLSLSLSVSLFLSVSFFSPLSLFLSLVSFFSLLLQHRYMLTPHSFIWISDQVSKQTTHTNML
jgi:hypothetical protein